MCKNKLDMRGLRIGTTHFFALLAMGSFMAATVACTVLMNGAVGAGDSAHCADKIALAGCLMSKVDHGVVNEFILANILLFAAGSVVFVSRHKIRELQESLFGCWRRYRRRRAEILCFQSYLMELFIRGILRSKIYGTVLSVD